MFCFGSCVYGLRAGLSVSWLFLLQALFLFFLFLSDVLLWGLGLVGSHHCIISTAFGLFLCFFSCFTRGGSKRARDEGGRGRLQYFLVYTVLPSVCRMPVPSIPWILLSFSRGKPLDFSDLT